MSRRCRFNASQTYLLIKDFATLTGENFDSLFIETDLSSTNNILMNAIYRPPNGNYDEFFNAIEQFLDNSNDKRKSSFSLRDFNTNLRNVTDSNATDFLNVMSTFLLRHLIKRPMRYHVGSNPSMLDNIFTNALNNVNIWSCVLTHDISNHCPIFFISSNIRLVKPKRHVINRSFIKDNISTFLNKLLNETWGYIFNTTIQITPTKILL